jgi:hypothetical protein
LLEPAESARLPLLITFAQPQSSSFRLKYLLSQTALIAGSIIASSIIASFITVTSINARKWVLIEIKVI